MARLLNPCPVKTKQSVCRPLTESRSGRIVRQICTAGLRTGVFVEVQRSLFFEMDWFHCFRKGKPRGTGGHKAAGPFDRGRLRPARYARRCHIPGKDSRAAEEAELLVEKAAVYLYGNSWAF